MTSECVSECARRGEAVGKIYEFQREEKSFLRSPTDWTGTVHRREKQYLFGRWWSIQSSSGSTCQHNVCNRGLTMWKVLIDSFGWLIYFQFLKSKWFNK